jgi:hypothetical protein
MRHCPAIVKFYLKVLTVNTGKPLIKKIVLPKPRKKVSYQLSSKEKEALHSAFEHAKQRLYARNEDGVSAKAITPVTKETLENPARQRPLEWCKSRGL